MTLLPVAVAKRQSRRHNQHATANTSQRFTAKPASFALFPFSFAFQVFFHDRFLDLFARSVRLATECSPLAKPDRKNPLLTLRSLLGAIPAPFLSKRSTEHPLSRCFGKILCCQESNCPMSGNPGLSTSVGFLSQHWRFALLQQRTYQNNGIRDARCFACLRMERGMRKHERSVEEWDFCGPV